MWETIKNDPLLKTITIILLSVLGFGFAFNIMFGQNTGNGMYGGEMGGSAYNLGNTLSYILLIAFKLLLIAFVMILLIAVVKFANKYLFKGEKITMENSNNNSILKVLGITAVVIIGIVVVWLLLGGITGHTGYYGMNGNSVNNMMNGSYGNNMMNGGYGYNAMGNGSYALGFSGVLAFLIKILLFVSVTGLIVGGAMYLSRNLPKNLVNLSSSTNTNTKCTVCDKTISSDYKLCPYCGTNQKINCETCGTELKPEWKCCPKCGEEKVTVEKGAVENN